LPKLFLLGTLILVLVFLPPILPASANQPEQYPKNVTSEFMATEQLTPLNWAKRLVDELKTNPCNNKYTAKQVFITWKGVNNAKESENRSVCSSFITLLLKQTYGNKDGFNFKEWMGFGTIVPKDKPDEEILAAPYYQLIANNRNRFQLITRVTDILPGDILAVKYSESSKSTDYEEAFELDENILESKDCPKKKTSTGHVVLVSEKPDLIRDSQSKPDILELKQYSIKVMDSSRSGHGKKDDSRWQKQSGSWVNGGAGEGIMRLYVNEQNEIQGYTWSREPHSTYYSQNEYLDNNKCRIPAHPLVVGRLIP
jgi:hypothetical protein